MEKKVTLYSAIILITSLFISCGGYSLESLSEADKVLLDQEMRVQNRRLSDVITEVSTEGTTILLKGERDRAADFDVINFLLPVLHKQGYFNLSFDFLKDVDPEALSEYMTGDNELSSEELLFEISPSKNGYIEYAQLLHSIKSFNQHLKDDEKSLNIVSSSDENTQFIYQCDDIEDDSIFKILLHAPIRSSKGKWELPFQGMLYKELQHGWPFYQFRTVSLKSSSFGYLYLSKEDKKKKTSVSESYDILLFLGGEDSLGSLHLIENFINEENALVAQEDFDELMIREKPGIASYLMNRKISKEYQKSNKAMEKIDALLRAEQPWENNL